MKCYDHIIVGSGIAGSVCARSLADKGKRVLILEKRDHVGGNVYDCTDEHGILIHKYGPHIFHTESQRVFDFLSRFTEWREYDHEVLAKAGSREFPVPFNLNSLYKVYPEDKAAELEKKLIDCYGIEKKVPIGQLRKNPDKDINALAEFVYENVFLHYTVKQWGQTPEEIDPDTTARVPVFISYDNRYFQDKYQGMPKEGYTPMFEKMLCHENITVMTCVDAKDKLCFEDDAILFEGNKFSGNIIYTGPADELFDYEYGALPYRTLDFEFEHHDMVQYQSHGTVNYTVDMPYTRITEFKHLTGQTAQSTTVMKEYSRSYEHQTDDIPYYAVINENNNAQYRKYALKAARYDNLILLGRLAEYKYYNMDKIALLAMELCDTLI